MQPGYEALTVTPGAGGFSADIREFSQQRRPVGRIARQDLLIDLGGLARFMRFQGEGYFLTDARTHRGTSGAPVVARSERLNSASLPWLLLGIHSSRLDVGTRDLVLDEALGLNCVWYADVLMALTDF